MLRTAVVRPLFCAASILVSVFLLSSCVSLNELDDLDYHASFCDTEDLQRLMDEGEDPNRAGGSPVWAVIYASGVESDCLASLQVLIEAGGSIDRREDGLSVLGAAVSGEVEPGIVRYLGALGADPCLPLEEQVDLDTLRRKHPGFEPLTLLDVAEELSSPEGIDELKELLVSCDSG